MKTLMFSIVVMLSATVLAIADTGTIQVERAQVYAEPRASDGEIVKILQRGNVVEIGLSILSDDGIWCAVSDANHRKLGYVRCSVIKRDPQPQRSTAYIQVPSTNSPPQAKSAEPVPSIPRRVPSERPSFASQAGLDYIRPLRGWFLAFQFTPEQQSAVDSLASDGGVTACRRQHEAHARTYERELTTAPPSRPNSEYERRLESMKNDFNRFAHPCMIKLLNVLDQLPNLMTPEQRSNKQLLKSFKEETSRMRSVLTSPDMYPGIR